MFRRNFPVKEGHTSEAPRLSPPPGKCVKSRHQPSTAPSLRRWNGTKVGPRTKESLEPPALVPGCTEMPSPEMEAFLPALPLPPGLVAFACGSRGCHAAERIRRPVCHTVQLWPSKNSQWHSHARGCDSVFKRNGILILHG